MSRTKARSHTAAPFTASVATLALLLGLALVPSATPLEAVSTGAGARLAGTWEIFVEPDPQSGVAPVVNFATLTRDGKIVNVDPGLGTAVGAWRNLSGTYAITFHGFMELGGQTLTYRVRGTVALDATAEQFSGPFVTEVRDLNGNLLLSFEGTVTATRLPVEPA